MSGHYVGLFAGYGVATLIAWALWGLRVRQIAGPEVLIPRPWLDLGLLVLAVGAVIGVGQAYSAGLLLDRTSPLTESVNQLAIFAPVLLVLALRPQPLRSAYLAPEASLGGVLGLLLALAAIGAYAVARQIPGELPQLLESILSPRHLPHAVQVFLEDVAVAAFLSRLAAGIGPRKAITVVAVLFAVAHVPAMISAGVGLLSMTSLVMDTLLGVLVLGAVVATRSIWWLVPVHFSLDMTQFYGG